MTHRLLHAPEEVAFLSNDSPAGRIEQQAPRGIMSGAIDGPPHAKEEACTQSALR